MSSYPQQPRVLFATLTECTSAAGRRYLRGWAGASNLVAFEGPLDDQGRPTWELFLTARPPKQDAQEARSAPDRPRASAPRPSAPPAARSAPARRESAGSRQERAARDALRRYGDPDLNDPVDFA